MSDQAVALDDSVLQESGHVCAFFNSRDQEYRVLLPFIQEGFERGERPFILSIQNSVRTTCTGCRQMALTSSQPCSGSNWKSNIGGT